MSRNMWILAVLISVLVIASIYREQSGMKMPDHLNCKESMFEQMFTDKCTPRTDINTANIHMFLDIFFPYIITNYRYDLVGFLF